MQHIEIELPPSANLSKAEKSIDATLAAVGLQVSLRGTLKKFPGCTHWHAKIPGQPARWNSLSGRNNTGLGSVSRAVGLLNGFPRRCPKFSRRLIDI